MLADVDGSVASIHVVTSASLISLSGDATIPPVDLDGKKERRERGHLLHRVAAKQSKSFYK